MDRHHQSRRASDTRHHDTKDSRRTHKYRHRYREPLAELQNDARRQSMQKDNLAPSVINRLENPLSEEPDYVRRWLAQTDELGKENQTAHPKSRLIDTGTAVKHKANSKSDGNSHLRHPFEQPNETKLTIAKRRHNSSSDSSILEAPIIPRARSTENERHTQRNDVDDTHQSSRNKKRKARSSSSEAAPPSVRHETFEKRPRHKTREDRYESKKDRPPKVHGEEKRPSKKRVSKTDRSKATKKAGEDLMRNFSSKSIGQERLTMRPPQGLGLFNNGRASSPAKRRGIPDLAFSEMDFLQHSYRHAPVEITQKSKSRTKYREKERQKSQKAQAEIADFFQPNRSVLQEIGTNDNSNFSKYRQEKELVDSWQDDVMNTDLHPPQFSLHQEEDYAQVRSNTRVVRPPSQQMLQSLQASLPTRNLRPSTSDSKQSGDGNTYISWSESQRTPATRPKGKMPSSTRPESPTPDYIQRSIEKTGVFRDTGISGFQDPRTSEESASSRYRSVEETNIAGSENVPSLESEEMLLDPPAAKSSVRLPQATRVPQRNTNCEDEARPPPRVRRAVNRESSTTGESPSQHSHVPIQHFHPEAGWQHNSDERNRPQLGDMVDDKIKPRSELTAAERAALAKHARIRPLSALSANQAGRSNSKNEKAELKAQTAIHIASGEAAEVVGGSAKVAIEKINSRGEPASQTAERGHERLKRPNFTPGILQISTDESQAGPVVQDRAPSRLLAQSAEHRLQTPASAESNAMPEYQRAECISHLGLPFREPFVLHRVPSPNMPLSRLTPITDPDPLFVRQFNEVNRGNDYHGRFLSQREHIVPNHAAQDEMPLFSNENIDINYQEEVMFDEHGPGDNHFDGSYLKELPHQPYQYDSMQTYDDEGADARNQRLWRPDLTPIREQSDEYDYVENQDWETQQLNPGPYAHHEEPQQFSCAHINDTARYQFGGGSAINEVNEMGEEDNHMEGFWRPQARW